MYVLIHMKITFILSEENVELLWLQVRWYGIHCLIIVSIHEPAIFSALQIDVTNKMLIIPFKPQHSFQKFHLSFHNIWAFMTVKVKALLGLNK